VEVEIIGVQPSQTTYAVAEEVEFTVDITNQLTTVTWSCTSGTFPYGNEGLTVTWQAPEAVSRPTISVHATDGMTEDDTSLDLIVTTLSNLGPAIDFLEPSYHATSEPFIPFLWYALNGRVTGLCFDKYC